MQSPLSGNFISTEDPWSFKYSMVCERRSIFLIPLRQTPTLTRAIISNTLAIMDVLISVHYQCSYLSKVKISGLSCNLTKLMQNPSLNYYIFQS